MKEFSAYRGEFSPALERGIAAQPVSPVVLRMLSEGFLSASLPPNYFENPSLRTAYLGFYLPMSIVKAGFVIEELRLRAPDFFAKDRITILEIGAGPLAATLGLLNYAALTGLILPPLHIRAIDRSNEIMSAGTSLLRGSFPETELKVDCSVEAIDSDLRLPRSAYDLIFIAHSLNEVPPSDHRTIGTIALNALKESGALIAIEPALRSTTRLLQRLRDELLSDASVRVLAPCTHSNPCPLNARPKDWCHEVRRWSYPSWFQRLDGLIGHQTSRIVYSFFVLSRDREPYFSRACERVISDSLSSKGKLERVLCGGSGRRVVTLLKRHKGHPDLLPFASVARGDRLVLQSGSEDSESIRLEPDRDRVELLESTDYRSSRDDMDPE